MKKTICLLPGDGIGPEIVAQGVAVLEAVAKKFGHEFDFVPALIGGAAIDATGEGELGLVVCDLFGKLAHHVVGNVGRVRDEHGERAHELGRHAGGEVTLHDVDGIRQAKRVAVLTRKGGRRGRDVRCRDEHAGPLARDGAAHAAGTTANLEHVDRAHRARGVNALERGIHDVG